MRIVFISINAPYKTNLRGTTALPYHLLKERSERVEVIVYTFNCNGLTDSQITEVEQELNVKIQCLKQPWWFRALLRFNLLSLRVFLRYPFQNYLTIARKVANDIIAMRPDFIWVNNEELTRIVRQFPQMRRIQIGSDVESLYYYRMMGRRFVVSNVVDYWKCAMMYRKYARMEREFCTDENFTYYAVGEADIEHLRQLAPHVNCSFLRHPHYAVAERGPVKFHQPKIRLLVAGQYNLYMQQTADEVLDFMTSMSKGESQKLKDQYVITFLGKGWEQHVESLKTIGFDVKHIRYAPDYLEEIIKHDIQVTPITIGTGTKGKVLDALANGLLVLGTPYAMENIAVEHDISCVVWETPSQLIDTLLDIPNNSVHFEGMAEAGRQAILQEHNPQIIAKQLFSCI